MQINPTGLALVSLLVLCVTAFGLIYYHMTKRNGNSK